MKPFEEPERSRFKFVIVAFLARGGGMEVIGPFDTVMAADMWRDTHRAAHPKFGWSRYEIVLMEAPPDAEAKEA